MILRRAAFLTLLCCCCCSTGCRQRQPTPAERLEAFIAQQQSNQRGALIHRDTIDGQPVVLLASSCKVYRLEPTSESVNQLEVLRPGFELWPSGCMSQRIWRKDGYLYAELINMRFGAGGGNATGGMYRSKNAVDWQKQTEKGWRAVAEAQP